ncbi:hypothetical protein J4405_04860 [Candidatus Woesearchaeota archaeon]|nr:hypothetical protein [Candidatus Woesearchaeota archaeon]
MSRIHRDTFTGSISEILNGKEFQKVVGSGKGIGHRRYQAIMNGITPLNAICQKHGGEVAHKDYVFTRFLELNDGHPNIMLGWIYTYIIPNPNGGLVTVINKVDLMGGCRDTDVYYEEEKPFLDLLADFTQEYGRPANTPYSGFNSDKPETTAVSKS